MVPIGAIFGNIFNRNDDIPQFDNRTSNSNKRVKVDKKTKEKKKKFLDIYGTNLTNKAINNELDVVIRKKCRNKKNYTNFK